ncbi:MAG: hypothetical protein PHX08_03675 [Lachnospiraceae bacterium]|nr:hypothetical protein [Lachnospiraceae bacterium]
MSEVDGIYDFDKITISDNGIGIDDDGYQRIINLRDNRKTHNNKGTGRVQYLHSFKDTTIHSTCQQSKNEFTSRMMTLSKTSTFCSQNALVRLDDIQTTNSGKVGTLVTFANPWVEKEANELATITIQNLKIELIRHFLSKFCDIREKFPQITICKYVDGKIAYDSDRETISSSDIQKPDKEIDFDINYSGFDEKGRVCKRNTSEKFTLRSFAINQEHFQENKLLLVSKGEEAMAIDLNVMLPKDSFEDKRFLFLLSSDYIDNNDNDTRGEITLFKEKDFKQGKQNVFIPDEVILLDDIEDCANNEIVNVYPHIKEHEEEKNKNLQELQDMFLINPSTIDNLRKKIKVTDSDSTILKYIYAQECNVLAENDAKIKSQIDEIKSFDPSDTNYQEKLNEAIVNFTSLVPQQNRTAITKYVARRKLVLELFGELLKKHSDANLEDGEQLKETLFHNLFYKQHSGDTRSSDLWLLDEDYIYFSGLSESELGKATVNGEPLFEPNLSDEQVQYKDKMNKDAGKKRTDVLLFPDEGKCLIIEFKAPNVNVSNHITQINRYATLIHNLSQEKFHFDTFYGYLIGENIDIDEIRDVDSSFKTAHNLGYIFRPHYLLPGKFGRSDGDLYTEVLKYSDILKRACLRNKIYIDILEEKI